MRCYQRGFGLPEVMISALLASFIIVALMQQYISMKRHYIQLQVKLERTTEAMLAVNVIQETIRQAGFTPCLSINYLTTIDRRNPEVKIIPISIKNHTLQINHMNAYFADVFDILSPTYLSAAQTTLINAKNPILIADCYHAEVHTVRDVQQSTAGQYITLMQPLAFEYTPPVYIGEWLEERFFVKPSAGLFYKRHNTDELTPLVTRMSLLLHNLARGILVQVMLDLNESDTMMIETRVRTF